MRARLVAGGVPVASDPPAWASLTTGTVPISGAAPAAGYGPPQVKLIYSTALARYSQVVAGRLPGRRRSVTGQQTVVQVAVTTATAARFGLRVGARLTAGPVQLLVTGILRRADTAADFWTQSATAAESGADAGLLSGSRTGSGRSSSAPVRSRWSNPSSTPAQMAGDLGLPGRARLASPPARRAGWRRASASWSPPGSRSRPPGP